jgi:hypothetical protein
MGGGEEIQDAALLLLQRRYHRHHALNKARTVLTLGAKATLAPLHIWTDRPVELSERIAPPAGLQNCACHFRGTRLLS